LVLEIDGDAEVDVFVHDERVTVEARVHVREVRNRIDDCTADERKVCERETLGGLERIFRCIARDVDVRVIDFHHAESVRSGALARNHMAAGQTTNLGERHDFVA